MNKYARISNKGNNSRDPGQALTKIDHAYLLIIWIRWSKFHEDDTRGGVAKRIARLTPNVEVVGSSSNNGPRCFLEQET